MKPIRPLAMRSLIVPSVVDPKNASTVATRALPARSRPSGSSHILFDDAHDAGSGHVHTPSRSNPTGTPASVSGRKSSVVTATVNVWLWPVFVSDAGGGGTVARRQRASALDASRTSAPASTPAGVTPSRWVGKAT